MEMHTLKIIFLICYAFVFVIRIYYKRKTDQNVIVDAHKIAREKRLRLFMLFGVLILPLTYILTPWLAIANYTLPIWVNLLGILMLVSSLWLLWRSHHDLGKNWSPTLQIREEQTLITNGIYQKVRHPMYTSLWLWVIAQALVLTNWIAGLSGMVTFGALYFTRVGEEEKMMLEQFGEEYKAYMRRTKRLLPYIL